MNWQQSLNGFPLPHGQSPAVSKYATLCTSVADLALYNETLLRGIGYCQHPHPVVFNFSTTVSVQQGAVLSDCSIGNSMPSVFAIAS